MFCISALHRFFEWTACSACNTHMLKQQFSILILFQEKKSCFKHRQKKKNKTNQNIRLVLFVVLYGTLCTSSCNLILIGQILLLHILELKQLLQNFYISQLSLMCPSLTLLLDTRLDLQALIFPITQFLLMYGVVPRMGKI